MFNTHQPLIEAYARRGPDQLARVLTFALLTIRMPLYRAVNDLEILDDPDERQWGGILFGIKGPGHAHIQRNKEAIYLDCLGIAETTPRRRLRADRLVERLSRVPGLGAAKAGFAAQMAFGVSGCLDTHNLKRFGIGERSSFLRLYRGNREHNIARYNGLIDDFGGTRKLWDSWCSYVAEKYPQTYPSAEEVSCLHTAVIV